jgi:hypothetical protein
MKQFTELLSVKDKKDPESYKKAYQLYRDGFRKGEVNVTGEPFSWKDAISVPHAAVWLPQVVTELAREAAEPLLVLTSLLEVVPWEPGLRIVWGSMGAITAGDIAEMQEYPEVSPQVGGATAVATVGKSGVKFKVTEEMKSSVRINIFGMMTKACGRALARHKEQKVYNYLSSMGVLIFDNENPSASTLGVTHGRDEVGNANGTTTADDVFDMFGQVIANGFFPNLLIMHPMTWVMWMKDPLLRTFALMAGGGAWWGSYTGQPAGRAPWGSTKTGESTGQSINPSTPLHEQPQAGLLTSAPVWPNYISPFPFMTIVSPFVYYNPQTKLTDILVADRNELGALVVQETIFTDEWTDKSIDVDFVKFRERYSIQIYNEGLAIAVAKNIRVAANAIVSPPIVTFDGSSLPAIPAFTAVV